MERPSVLDPFDIKSEQVTILIVDDSVLGAQLVQMHLERAGYQVQLAHTGSEALASVEANPPDLIILDVMMPGMDGFEVCKQLKNDPSTKAIRVIAMTGYPTPENVEKIVSLGAETCIEKPFSNQALLEAIGIRTERKT